MLTDSDNHHLIEWTDGKIRVHDPHRLESDVLSRFFRHSKYSSLQRQLNYFGFKKVDSKGKMSPCWFVNEYTSADLASLMSIKRKPANRARKAQVAAKRQNSYQSVNSSSSDSDLSESEDKPKTSRVPKEQQEENTSKKRIKEDTAFDESINKKICEALPVPSEMNLGQIPVLKEAAANAPIVVHTAEYDAPGTVDFMPTSCAAPSIPTAIVSGTAVPMFYNMPSYENFFLPLTEQQQQQQESPPDTLAAKTLQQQSDKFVTKFNVPNPLAHLSNMSSPVQVTSAVVPSPIMPTAMPSNLATEAVNNVENNCSSSTDISYGFPSLLEKSGDTVATADEILSLGLPSSEDLFPSCECVMIRDSINMGLSTLSPASSLVNLACIPGLCIPGLQND